MKNSFKNAVVNQRNIAKAVEAEKVAKEIQAYGGLEVYDDMKRCKMYAIVVDGVVVGGANSKEDAEKAVEFLTHFTNGKVLNAETVVGATMRATEALRKGQNLIEAEESGIGIKMTCKIGDDEYIIDEYDELYTIEGKHITNVSDVVEGVMNKGLSEELFKEILASRIKAVEEEANDDDDADAEDGDEYDEYDDDWGDDDDYN